MTGDSDNAVLSEGADLTPEKEEADLCARIHEKVKKQRREAAKLFDIGDYKASRQRHRDRRTAAEAEYDKAITEFEGKYLGRTATMLRHAKIVVLYEDDVDVAGTYLSNGAQLYSQAAAMRDPGYVSQSGETRREIDAKAAALEAVGDNWKKAALKLYEKMLRLGRQMQRSGEYKRHELTPLTNVLMGLGAYHGDLLNKGRDESRAMRYLQMGRDFCRIRLPDGREICDNKRDVELLINMADVLLASVQCMRESGTDQSAIDRKLTEAREHLFGALATPVDPVETHENFTPNVPPVDIARRAETNRAQCAALLAECPPIGDRMQWLQLAAILVEKIGDDDNIARGIRTQLKQAQEEAISREARRVVAAETRASVAVAVEQAPVPAVQGHSGRNEIPFPE